MEQTSSKSYLPLFRKYRPQSFKDVVGQESLVRALSNAIELNRIANAYLFCGPRGTGKTSSARIFAKSLNCEHGPTLEPCQKCASCQDITNTTGLDVIEIDAASNRGIQDAKELISQVQYAPINGKYKIFIIDEVHMLSNDAFNALLKTFEEPPENVIFILATTEPHKVLETIVSRCQRFDLRRITTDDIIKRLREISDLENIKITSEALFTIAKNVSGGLRDSLALLDQVSILGVKEEITKDLIEELLGKINFDIMLNLLKNIASQNIEQSIQAINEIYTKGNEPRNLAENFIEFLRNIILILNSSDDENITKLTCLIKEDIEKVRNANFNKDNIVKILNILIEYYKEIKISTNPYLWMELAAIAACKLDLNINNTNINQELKPVISQNIQKPQIQSQIQPQPKAQTQAQSQPQTKKEIEEIEKVTSNQSDKLIEIKEELPPISTTPTQLNNQNQQSDAQDLIQPIQSANQADINTQNTNNSSINPAQIWTNIIAAIPSLPSRAFYSGVAKLVNIENQKITIGFLHENVLAQARSENKISQLKSAVKKVANDFEIELIKISDTTKTIPVDNKASKIKTQEQFSPQRTNTIQNTIQEKQNYNELNSQNQIQQSSYNQNPIENNDEDETQKEKKGNYSPQVQDMIEQFNGRIIE